MALLVMSVFDSKVGAFANPFCVRTKGEAHRSFEDACKDENLPFKKHPADFALFHIGSFDDNDGSLVPIRPERVIGADEF